MSSTVRFSQIVEAAGRPRLHVLWGPPASDAEFQSAIKAERVMTIHQENVGSKKDFGLIGFSPETPAQFLIFPRSLQAFHGRRVVGINYDIFDPPPPPASSSKKENKKSGEATVRKIPTPELKRATPKRVAPAAPPTARKEPPPEPETAPAVSHSGKEKRLHIMETPAAAAVAAARRGTREMTPDWDRGAVLKEVKSAMKELEAGKAVLVFRRLEKLANRLSVSR